MEAPLSITAQLLLTIIRRNNNIYNFKKLRAHSWVRVSSQDERRLAIDHHADRERVGRLRMTLKTLL